MRRRTFLVGAAAAAAAAASGGHCRVGRAGTEGLIRTIDRQTLWRNRDGKRTTWFHPRGCALPLDSAPLDSAPLDGQRRQILVTMQEIGGSDYFGPVHFTTTEDQGATWSVPRPIKSLGRVPVAGQQGLLAGVCDVVPQYHALTKSVLALGHVVFYRGPRFAAGDQLARYPVYAVRRADGSWSPRRRLIWDDPRGAFIYTNNCGQRVVLPNGDILMAFSFGPESRHRMVAGVRCRFDGHQLLVAEVGPALHNRHGRGLLEPSVTRFDDRYFLTIRAEDGHGYVAVSPDGVHYGPQRAWAWEDGQTLTMSTTQQHWLTHSDALFLVYTRRDASNVNVVRWRAPLWMARVDPQRLCLIRSSERIVQPLSANGVTHPDDVALMGNFHVVHARADESWITVGERLPRRGARGDVLLARVRWSRPNLLLESPAPD